MQPWYISCLADVIIYPLKFTSFWRQSIHMLSNLLCRISFSARQWDIDGLSVTWYQSNLDVAMVDDMEQQANKIE